MVDLLREPYDILTASELYTFSGLHLERVRQILIKLYRVDSKFSKRLGQNEPGAHQVRRLFKLYDIAHIQMRAPNYHENCLTRAR